MTSITVQSPAKLNLGLEITGRRSDGFHDLTTIFLTVDLTDTLTISVGDRSTAGVDLTFTSDSGQIDRRDNLVTRAVHAVRSATGMVPSLSITLSKRIPIAAGLGGASSNAASTLVGMNVLFDLNLSATNLDSLALGLGSDVPFFLRQGCALGAGRGDVLRALPCPKVWFVLLYPRASGLPTRKTAALFAALTPQDLTDGSAVAAQAKRLERSQGIDPRLLGNTFARPMGELAPVTIDLARMLTAAGAPFVAMSGAGPTLYTVVETREAANRIAQSYVSLGGDVSSVYVCASRCRSTFGDLMPTSDARSV